MMKRRHSSLDRLQPIAPAIPVPPALMRWRPERRHCQGTDFLRRIRRMSQAHGDRLRRSLHVIDEPCGIGETGDRAGHRHGPDKPRTGELCSARTGCSKADAQPATLLHGSVGSRSPAICLVITGGGRTLDVRVPASGSVRSRQSRSRSRADDWCGIGARSRSHV